jgi:hypothetical protein
MPKLDKETKERIKGLSHKELQDIVLRFASKEKTVYDYILVTYLNQESGEQELFETAKADLDILFSKSYKGFSQELRLAKMLSACIKRVNEFTKVSNNKVLEAELLLFVLRVPFSLTTNLFGTCFTQYDTKVAMIVKRLITLVNKGLHEDYRIEYVDTINKYLSILHRTSNHINMVYDMPEKIEI